MRTKSRLIAIITLFVFIISTFTSCMGSEPDFSDPNLNVDSLHKVWQFKYYTQLNLSKVTSDFASSITKDTKSNLKQSEEIAIKFEKFGNLVKNQFKSEKGSEEVAKYLLSLSEFFKELNNIKDKQSSENAMSKINDAKNTYNGFGNFELSQIFETAIPCSTFINSGLPQGICDGIVLSQEQKSDDTITLTFGGNTMFGNPSNSWQDGFNKQYYNDKKPTDFPLVGVAPFFLNDDLSLITYEGQLTTKGAKEDDGFNGFAEYAKILKSNSIDVASLATEHAFDFYEAGKNETKQILGSNNVKTFDDSSTVYIDTKIGKIALLSYQIADDSPRVGLILRDEINKANKEKADIIIVNFHWGNLEDENITSYQKKFAKMAVNYGADIVMGSHPYIIQGMEYYKNKPIIYSMGNLSHGGDKDVKHSDAFMFRIKIKKLEKGYSFEDYSIIPVTISKEGNTKYMPSHAYGADADRIINKITELSNVLDNPAKINKW